MEAKRMKDIYTKLMVLTLAREQEPEFTQVQIKDLFADLANSFSLQLQEQKVYLDMNTTLDVLLLDRTLIHMLLGNLIKNSLQALPQGGKISLKAYHSEKGPILEVSDNGYGIPEEKINEVIKPFYRVDKSRSRKTGGAGLGLSICKSIAKLHQADLKIESEVGKGTIIKIIFYNSVTTS
jgi:signal transduction histidine kinase